MLAEPNRHGAIVVGAGPAGLAAGAMLKRRGVDTLLVDRTSRVGEGWRGHYDRLHLHTVRWLSNLPGLPIPRSEGRWVSKDGVARYLEAYASHHRLRILHDTEVRRINRAEDGGWLLRTDGPELRAEHVVMASGYNRTPWLPRWPGTDSFTGDLIHSSDYRNPGPYRGRDVLVVGTGNSGAEIAADLVEGGARQVTLSVRTPPNILPRAIAGLPTQVVGVTFRRFPRTVTDAVAGVTRRLVIGDLSRYGMPQPPRGPYTRVVEDDIIPILDVGLVRQLKAGRVRVVPAVERFEGSDVVLVDGARLQPDAVIAATGFRRGLEDLVGHLGVVGPTGRPVVHGASTHPKAPNMYFIGYTNPISGNLRELGIDARRIARAIQRKKAPAPT